MSKGRIPFTIILLCSLLSLLAVSSTYAKKNNKAGTAIPKIKDAIDEINALDPDVFQKKRDKNKLNKNLNIAIKYLNKGRYDKAHKKLEKNVLKKMVHLPISWRKK